jgi:CHAD domain-containing protein
MEHADRLLEELADRIACASNATGADEVHDLRVAIRRLKAVLKSLAPCFPGREARRVDLGLKRIMGLAGEVRNRDIGVELLVKMSGPAATPQVIRFENERVAAASNLAKALQAIQRSGTPANWHNMLHKARKRQRTEQEFCVIPADATAARLLPEIADKHFKRGEKAATQKISSRKLHRFRIATKKFRYTLDLFAPFYGESVANLISELKHIQTLLGDLNDYETIRGMVRSSAPESDEATQISAEIRKKRQEKAAEFREHWRKAFCEERVTEWRSDLQRLARNGKIRAGSRP